MLWVPADLIAYYVLDMVKGIEVREIAFVLMGALTWHAMSDAVVGQRQECPSCLST
jgi:hypothetical protein